MPIIPKLRIYAMLAHKSNAQRKSKAKDKQEGREALKQNHLLKQQMSDADAKGLS